MMTRERKAYQTSIGLESMVVGAQGPQNGLEPGVPHTCNLATAASWTFGPLDLEEAKKSWITGPQSALATAQIISDIHAVSYSEVSSPNPALNQNAREGKFRYVICGVVESFVSIAIYRYGVSTPIYVDL